GKQLDVSREGEWIKVKFTDMDAQTAEDAVHVVIDSYARQTKDEDPENPRMREAALLDIQTRYNSDLATAKDEINKIVATFGTEEALRTEYSYKLRERNQSESDWN